MTRLLALAATILAACRAGEHHHAAGAPTEPKLVVLVVVDQWPEWAFEHKRPALHGGFQRLLAEGRWHVGHHPTGMTLTAPGHSLLGTGRTPSDSGIVANEWYHRDLGRDLKSVEQA
ncbi:MAG TPA: alkaline phosphatase family protein, partial [Kofleriaceae bacterium]|nr:alkaline phosphatase family protein [Kofleriaceae bacterium]